MPASWHAAAAYRRWATALVAIAWLPTLGAGLLAPPEAEPFSATILYALVTPLAVHLALLVLGWALSAPYPNSAIGVMLLSPLGILAALAVDAALWLPDLAPVRALVGLALIALLAWASGRWAADLVLTDTMDTMT